MVVLYSMFHSRDFGVEKVKRHESFAVDSLFAQLSAPIEVVYLSLRGVCSPRSGLSLKPHM